MPTTLTDEAEPVNLLLYGSGGTGKTTDLAAIASQGKVWMANAESGIKGRALKRVAEELGIEIPLPNIEIFPDPNKGEELSIDGLEAEWRRIREALHEDPTAYVATQWDSITEIQQQLKDYEVKRSTDKARRRGQERDPYIVDQDNWRTINEQCRSLIRKFRDLPCHFGATALERREQDSSSRVIYMPAVTPGLQNDLIGWFDVVGHTETIWVGGDQYFLAQFVNQGLWQGKDRFKALPKKLVNPTHDRIIAYIDGDLTVDTDDEMQQLRSALEAQDNEKATA